MYFASGKDGLASSRREAFVERCRGRFGKVWTTLAHNGRFLALCSGLDNELIIMENSGQSCRVGLYRNLSYAVLVPSASDVAVYCCEGSSIESYDVTELGKVHRETPRFALHGTGDVHLVHRIDSTTFWVVRGHTAILCIKGAEAQRVDLQTHSNFLSAQVLSSTTAGQNALLAVHYSSSSSGGSSSGSSSSGGDGAAAAQVEIFVLDIKWWKHQVQQGTGGKTARQVHLKPTCLVPFSTTYGDGNGRGSASVFGFGRSAAAQAEQVVRCEIDRHTVRHSTINPASGGDGRAVVSFTVHLLGSQGNEVEAQFTCPEHKILDRLEEEGCTIFSRPSTALGPNNAADADLTVTTHYADGNHSQPIQVLGQNSTSVGSSVPLWRLLLKSHVVPSYRQAALQAQVQALDAAAPSSSSADSSAVEDSRYFAVARAVLVEAALLGGQAHLVAEYVLHPAVDLASRSAYLLSDVRRFHESLMGAEQSVQMAVESALRALCRDHLIPALLQDRHQSQRGLEQVAVELKSVLDVVSGLRTVTEALLERKMQALEVGDVSDSVLQGVIEEGQSALRLQLQELDCLSHILNVLQTLFSIPNVSFRTLLTGELHHQHSQGRVHSSASSAAAAASMLSEYQLQRAARADAAQQSDMPDYLLPNPSGLLGCLFSLLDPTAQEEVEFLIRADGVAMGVNIHSLATTVTALLLLPLTALRRAAEAAGERARGLGVGKVGAERGDSEAAASSAVTVAFSVVLFFLAEMLHGSLSTAHNDVDNNGEQGWEVVLAQLSALARATNIAPTVRNGVIALWCVEADVAVPQAVQTICSHGECTVAQDAEVLCAVIRRLLSARRLRECQELLTHLRLVDSPAVKSKFFVMATAVAVGRVDQWKFCWQRAKELSFDLHPQGSAEGTELRRELVHVFVRFALRHDELGSLLDCALDKEESAEVEVVLRALAQTDIAHARCPSPAVDAVVAFLLRNGQFEQAAEVHEIHAQSVAAACSQQPAWGEMQQLLGGRLALIMAQASVPTIPKECFAL